MQETGVRSLGREGPLEKEMAIHSGTLAWKIPWMDECGRLQSMGLQRVRHDGATSLVLGLFSRHCFPSPPLASIYSLCGKPLFPKQLTSFFLETGPK